MQIVDVIKTSTELLGLTNENVILQTATQDNETEVLSNPVINKLYGLVKFAVQELCSNYATVLAEKVINTNNCSYPLNQLKNYIRFHAVKKNGESVDYKIINRNLTLIAEGEYVVEYETYPEINSLFDDVDYFADLSPDVIVFALCSYYALSVGLFEDFKEFNNQYVERAENLKGLKIFNLPQRRWE